MKGSLRNYGLTLFQPAQDLRLLLDRDTLLNLACLKLSWRAANEHDILTFNYLKSGRRNGDCLLAEFSGKLNVGEHIRLKAQVVIRYVTTNSRRSCLRIENVSDIGDFAFEWMIRVCVNRDKGALPHADTAQVLFVHLRLDQTCVRSATVKTSRPASTVSPGDACAFVITPAKGAFNGVRNVPRGLPSETPNLRSR